MNRDNKTFPTRRNMFMVGGAVLFGGLAIRLADLQLFHQHQYDEMAKDNHIRLDPAPPHRGTIYDRMGRPIASNKRTFFVTLTPEQIGEKITQEDISALVERIGQIIPVSESRKRRILLDARTQPKYQEIVVADDLTWEDFAKINARAPELTGVAAEVGEQRSYPYYAAFFHTVGYVARPNDSDIAKMVAAEQAKFKEDPASDEGKARAASIKRLYLDPQMRVGKQGMEAYAEQALKGKPGRIASLVNAGGRVIEPVPTSNIPGEQGKDLVLSLDAELQNYAIQRFGEESGAAVVIDIKTGEIIVMMSTPGPDPNRFVSGIASDYWAELQSNEKAPLIHKAYEGIYPPGSTFKMVVAAAALESGAMTPETRVNCSGGAFYYTRVYHCWRPEGHGSVNLHQAIQKSCDCYFYAAAQRTGIEKIAEMAKRLGYGHRYEIGITGGNRYPEVANDEWKRRRFKEKWYDGDTISAGIGQGYILMTPLLNAVMISRLAGGPSVPRPRLVHDGVDVPDQTVTPMGDLSETTLKAIREGMHAVCCEAGGTAYSYLKGGGLDTLGDLPEHYRGAQVAGKSGSAQVRIIDASQRGARGKQLFKEESLPWKLRDHAHFVAYAPADNPRYACAITVEHGSHGSEMAAPFARDILYETLKADPGNKPVFQAPKQVAANVSEKT